MSPHEIANWMRLYFATFMCCGIAMAMTVAVVAMELWRDMVWRHAQFLRGSALLLPRVWWRWQKGYFLSTPVTLVTVGTSALSLHW